MRPEAYRTFTRAEWALLRANTPLTLTEEELRALRGLNESVSLDEIADVYLPLSRLLNLHVRAARNLNSVTDTFVGRPIADNNLCQNGTLCVATGEDRRLGDFFTNAVDERGCVLVATFVGRPETTPVWRFMVVGKEAFVPVT